MHLLRLRDILEFSMYPQGTFQGGDCFSEPQSSASKISEVVQ